MMTIKDLSVSKELDRKAMADVRGGDANQLIGSTTSATAQQSVQNLGGIVAAVQTPTANSVIQASNSEHNPVSFKDSFNSFDYGHGYGYGYRW
jgi:hypothetical protein